MRIIPDFYLITRSALLNIFLSSNKYIFNLNISRYLVKNIIKNT